MKRTFLFLLLSICLTGLANAGTLVLEEDLWGYGESARVSHNSTPIGNPDVFAGQILVTLDGSSPFATYCLDLLGLINDSQEVEVRSLSEMGDNGEKIAWLLNTYANGVGSDSEGAGLQLAIWEVLYDTSYDLSGGIFTVNSASEGALTRAGQYLGSVGRSDVIWFDTRSGQDLGAPVPEPGSLLLLGSGIGVLALAFKRRKQ